MQTTAKTYVINISVLQITLHECLQSAECRNSTSKYIHGHLEVHVQMSINAAALQQQQHTSSTESLSLYSQSSQHQTHHCSQPSIMYSK